MSYDLAENQYLGRFQGIDRKNKEFKSKKVQKRVNLDPVPKKNQSRSIELKIGTLVDSRVLIGKIISLNRKKVQKG